MFASKNLMVDNMGIEYVELINVLYVILIDANCVFMKIKFD